MSQPIPILLTLHHHLSQFALQTDLASLAIPRRSVIAITQGLGLNVGLPGACPAAACCLFRKSLARDPPGRGIR